MTGRGDERRRARAAAQPLTEGDVRRIVRQEMARALCITGDGLAARIASCGALVTQAEQRR